MVIAGKLRHRIALVRLVEGSKNDYGEAVTSEQIVEQPWADVRIESSGETAAAGGMKGQKNYLIEIRWRPSIDSALRVRYGNVLLAVDGVHDPDGRRVRLHLKCHEHEERV